MLKVLARWMLSLSLCNPKWNWFMSATSLQEIMQANCLDSDAYIAVKHDIWWRDHILMLDVHSLSKFPKVALNFSRNVSKSLHIGDWCSNKGANQTRVMLDNKVPMNPTWARLVGYQWGWSWMTKCTWLTKLQNFEHVPSNLLHRLICGSFG